MNSKYIVGEKFSASLQCSHATSYPDFEYYIDILNIYKSSNFKLKSDNFVTYHALKCSLSLNSLWSIYIDHIKLLVVEN